VSLSSFHERPASSTPDAENWVASTAGRDSFPTLPTNNLMADLANKYAENTAGKFYVDDQCIDCDLCRETAPANFKRNDDGGHSYVYKQPENPSEESLCKEAMEGCPVEAIGSDGE
jgi:ferredoxin